MIVYKAKNKINNKIYIGQTVRSLEWRKYHHELLARRGSKIYFHNSIRKNGSENFEWEILCECKNRKELNQKEIMYIKRYKTLNRNFGYNTTPGGSNGGYLPNHPRREEIKEQIRKTLTGRTLTEEHKRNISKGELGRIQTQTTKDKLSKAQKGRRVLDSWVDGRRLIKRKDWSKLKKLFEKGVSVREASKIYKINIRTMFCYKRQVFGLLPVKNNRRTILL